MEHDVRFNSKFDSPQVTKWLKNQKVMHTSICQAIQLACSICGDTDLPTAIASIKAQQRIRQKQMQANGIIPGYPGQPMNNTGYAPYPQYQQPYYPMNNTTSYSGYQSGNMPSRPLTMSRSYKPIQPSVNHQSPVNLKANDHKKNSGHGEVKQKSKKINHNDLGNLFKDLKK